MIGGGLDEITHAINRIIFRSGLAAIAVESALRSGAFFDVAIGGIKPLHGFCDRRCEICEFPQFVARDRPARSAMLSMVMLLRVIRFPEFKSF